MSVLEELADYLVAQGAAAANQVYVGRMPPDPDDAVALYGYSGPPGEFVLGQRLPIWENASVQVVARSASWPTAWATARAAQVALGSVLNQVLGTTKYAWVKVLQSPFELERDVNERISVAFNVQANRVPA